MIKESIGLKNGSWEAVVCPRLGANITELKYNGTDVLRPLTDEELLKKSKFLYGAPILMPANRTVKGSFSFEGKKYVMPINEPANDCNLHGAVLFEAFDVVEMCENRAVMRLIDKECRSYPFPFSLTVSYRLDEDGLYSSYEIENIGDGNMPLTFALHTTFIEPDFFSVPIKLCQEKDEHHIPTGRYTELNELQRSFRDGSPSKGVFITGYFLSSGDTAVIGDYRYRVSGGFDHWILFNGKGESGLLCTEPQCGRVNGLNSENGHTVLGKGESVLFTTTIYRG